MSTEFNIDHVLYKLCKYMRIVTHNNNDFSYFTLINLDKLNDNIIYDSRKGEKPLEYCGDVLNIAGFIMPVQRTDYNIPEKDFKFGNDKNTLYGLRIYPNKENIQKEDSDIFKYSAKFWKLFITEDLDLCIVVDYKKPLDEYKNKSPVSDNETAYYEIQFGYVEPKNRFS